MPALTWRVGRSAPPTGFASTARSSRQAACAGPAALPRVIHVRRQGYEAITPAPALSANARPPLDQDLKDRGEAALLVAAALHRAGHPRPTPHRSRPLLTMKKGSKCRTPLFGLTEPPFVDEPCPFDRAGVLVASRLNWLMSTREKEDNADRSCQADEVGSRRP